MLTVKTTMKHRHLHGSIGSNHSKSLVKDKVRQIAANLHERSSKGGLSPFAAIGTQSETTASTDEQQPRATNLSQENVLVETDAFKVGRQRTFSHWPSRGIPSAAEMIAAGFFSCNVTDRVICLYCHLIAQGWITHTDDPQEVHETLAPHCPYVLSMKRTRQTVSIAILNDNWNTQSPLVSALRPNDIVYTVACHPTYVEMPKRYASFASWPSDPLPSVDDLVRAGFFFTGTQTVTTCFYCNGSLQNWSATDDPSVEHCRWFPHCAYARQLCGEKLYHRIQESKRIQQERTEAGQSKNSGKHQTKTNGQLLVSDEAMLSRLVAARLDLPISQSLLKRGFSLSVIKRCWEDQLRLKQDDFVSEFDLFIVCQILQKQIDVIQGNKENIIIPSQRLKSSRSDEQPSQSIVKAEPKSNSEESPSPIHPCTLCLTEEKKLACIPCGHVATCVSCGHSLRICPICRTDIDGFVRIYL